MLSMQGHEMSYAVLGLLLAFRLLQHFICSRHLMTRSLIRFSTPQNIQDAVRTNNLQDDRQPNAQQLIEMKAAKGAL